LGKFDNEYHREKRSFFGSSCPTSTTTTITAAEWARWAEWAARKELQLLGGRREVGRGEVFFVPIAIQPQQGFWELF
jgi:hypothetical protein